MEYKFIAWHKQDEKFYEVQFNNYNYQHKREYVPFVVEYGFSSFELDDFELILHTGLKDIHGQEIYYDSSIFTFKLVTNYKTGNWVSCLGYFTFDKVTLRARINFYINNDNFCFDYVANEMLGFKIIGTLQENPELLKANNADS